jgi:anti-sigma B factor antagonist
VCGEFEGANAGRLTDALDHAIEGDRTRVLLDLSDCSFVDSAVLAPVVDGASRVTDAGRRLWLICAHPQVRRIFALTGIDQSVPVFDAVPPSPSAPKAA